MQKHRLFPLVRFTTLVLATTVAAAGELSLPPTLQGELVNTLLRETMLTVDFGRVAISPAQRAKLKALEDAGLFTVTEVPRAYWDSFLAQTQGFGTPFDVTPTPKGKRFFQISEGATGVGRPIYDISLTSVVLKEPYKGELSTPGEQYQLVLGIYSRTPNNDGRTLGAEVADQAPAKLRFRSIVKYSPFTKAWSVVALDSGSLNPEKWYTQRVK